MGGGGLLAAARLPVRSRRDPRARGSGIPRAAPRPGGAGRAHRRADVRHRDPGVRPGRRPRRRPDRGLLRRAHPLRWRAPGAVPGGLPPDGDPLLRGPGAVGARRPRLAGHGAPGRLDGGGERAGPRARPDPGGRGPAPGRLAPPGGGHRDRAGDAQELDRGPGDRPHLVEYRDQPLPRQQSPVRRDGGHASGPRLAGARPGAAAPRRVRRGAGLPLLRGARHGVCRARAGRVPRLQVRKLRLLAGGAEIPRNQELYPARAWSPVLWVLLWKVPGLAFPFGLLLPLAAVGLGVAWRRAPVLAASVVLLGLAVAAFFVTGRYRAPLVPLLAVFAAAGVRWAAIEASGRARVAAGAVAVGVYLLANLGQGPMPRPDERRRRAGPGALARARGPAPGGPRALRAARARGPGLVRRVVRGRPAGAGARAPGRGRRGAGERFASWSRSSSTPRSSWRAPASRPGAGPRRRSSPAARWRSTRGASWPGRSSGEAQALRAARPGGPSGGCPDQVFVAPFALAP